MKIVVVDFAASKRGALSILHSLYNYIIENESDNEWYFLLSEEYILPKSNIHIILLKKEKKLRVFRMLFDLFYGRFLINKLEPNVVFYLQNTLVHGVKAPQVVYMDQPIPFQNAIKFSFLKQKERSLAIYQNFIGYFVKKACMEAASVIVQTEWMKNAIIRECKIEEGKIFKIEPEIRYHVYNDKDEPYDYLSFFYPAGHAIYKNHACIVEALSILRARTNKQFKVFFTLSKYKEYTSIKEIECVGELTHKETLARLRKQVLLFPSYIETYGLPLAEAKSVNSLILAADTEFAREILVDYPNAYFFNPFKPVELANLMLNIIQGNIVKKDSNSLVSSEVKENTWSKVFNVLLKSIN